MADPKLTPRSERMFVMRRIEGKTLATIAKEFQISTSRVQQITRKFRRLLLYPSNRNHPLRIHAENWVVRNG